MAESRPWVAVAPPDLLVALEPLAAAHAQHGPTRLVALEEPDGWRAAVPGARSVLVVGAEERIPATTLPGPLVHDGDGRAIPVGWMPASEELSDGMRAMAEVAARRPSGGVVVLLGGRDERHRGLLDGIQSGLEGRPVYRWDAARASRHSMLRGLQLGPAVALYAGHGTPRGWAAYGGVVGRDLARPREPVGALVCLACSVAARPPTGRSFAEEVVAGGGAGAILGAIQAIPHAEHVAMAAALVHSLNSGPSTIGELICHPALPVSTLSLYRIVGDPAAPLGAAVGAGDACGEILALAPGEAIPPLPAGWWPRDAN